MNLNFDNFQIKYSQQHLDIAILHFLSLFDIDKWKTEAWWGEMDEYNRLKYVGFSQH